MENMEVLRCSHCGAPLPTSGFSPNSEVITCQYCGTSQRKVDVERYLDELRTEMFSWIKSMVPTGLQAVSQVDPVARAQLFEQLVRQGMSERMDSMSMQLIRIGSTPLLAAPFATVPAYAGIGGASPPPSPGPVGVGSATGYASSSLSPQSSSSPLDPKSILAEAARLQSVSALAESDEQKAFLDAAVSTAEALGYLTNILKLSADPDQRSYRTLAKNFESAAASLSKDASWGGAAARMHGLASASSSIASFMEGDAAGAATALAGVDAVFTGAMTDVLKQSSTMAWFPAIKAEKTVAASVGLITASSGSGGGGDPAGGLGKLERYVKAFESGRRGTGRILGTGDFLDPATFMELGASFSAINRAKAGTAPVSALVGAGRIWVACWLVDVTYSFETGMSFMKKGQAVQERMLIPGTFSLHPDLLVGNPSALVTDIFATRSGSGYMDRIRGREKSLTSGQGFSDLGQAAKAAIPYPEPVVPTISTRLEAEKVANIYLEKARQTLQGKLRIGIPSVTELVYVKGDLVGGRLAVPGLPDSMYPLVGDDATLAAFSL